MPSKLAIIHTTPVTVGLLKGLVKETIPGCDVFNIMDDSILPQLAAHEGQVEGVEERFIQYMKIAEGIGGDAILSACSSVGELVEKASDEVSIPVVRIDEAMAEEAVRRSEKIGVAATLPTTLHPTIELLRHKGKEMGRQIDLESTLAEKAYHQLMAGDQDGHDQLLAAALHDLSQKVDIIVLAQASMARVIKRLDEGEQEKFLTSPELGVQRVKQILA